ncbi:hypothetical protein MUB24_15630 [Lederbergia sp. NSJ-179]|uniref:hypothetical protein n=1 Tax=Lederbergia sp. NSJ-179 TaxID=2931402 RepID=UPI001FCFCE64|nr:hypothetical protein [Lederbergia sp. NSJ-179]MCJ7842299.1 hypothetical protein [Lederbergia sp. NSJ-179]
MIIRITRDSVAMGDDVYAPHEKIIDIPDSLILKEMVQKVGKISYLPSIYGGEATWVLYNRTAHTPLAVLAQQWENARFFDRSRQTLGELFSGKEEGELFFRYLGQEEPLEVFQELS